MASEVAPLNLAIEALKATPFGSMTECDRHRLKFLLWASHWEREKRRFGEREVKGEAPNCDEVQRLMDWLTYGPTAVRIETIEALKRNLAKSNATVIPFR